MLEVFCFWIGFFSFLHLWGKPHLDLESPKSGWTTSRMFEIKGKCSDSSVSLVWVNVNGARYFIQTEGGGKFQKKNTNSKGYEYGYC